MSDETKMTRRVLLGSTAAVATALAGCASGEGTATTIDTATDTETATETATATDTATATETETRTEEPTTLENFAYPDGASRSGIVGTELFGTHRSSIVDAGSAALGEDRATDRDGRTSSAEFANAYSADGISRVKESGDLTETLWSAASEDAGYVQMDTGFEQAYRIDNETPDPQEVLRLSQFEGLLVGGEWGEATGLAESENGEHAVSYESTGVANEERLLSVFFGEDVSEFEARVWVSEAGYVDEVTYDVTVERGDRTVQQKSTVTVSALGETTVEEPAWAGTARERGVRFSAESTDGGRLVALELTNGDVSSGVAVNLSARRFARGELAETLTEGDTLYIGLSESGELLNGVNEQPSGSTNLGDFAFVALRDGDFRLFEQDVQL
ncbi:hypothetical protein G9C85_02085 [Halorubellus sp. JP-L1]|uniref:hypothetical protein n=1 Tax=Halorubellus sp. JP-L1 TaxID=2715753 RepID=UPI0014096DE3|nr:hypothetical protein [Halorubellus sp. JP-L1]NHN40425.1 hypothetical protein [Halorubellus sp. JP-L1]